MSLERRLRKLEVAHFRRSLANAGAPYGVSADELLEEARRFLALPLPAQLAEWDALTPTLRGEGFTEADLADARRTLIQSYRPID